MSKLYEDLINIIEYEPDKDVELQVQKWCKTLQRISDINNVLPSMLLLYILFLYWFGGLKGSILYIALLVVCLVLYKSYNKRQKAKINNMMSGCCFNKQLTGNMVIARYARGVRDAKKLLPAIGNSLFYLGKFEEGKRVMDLVKKYCDTPEGNAPRAIYYAMVARTELDKETVKHYIKELEMLMQEVKAPYIAKSYEVVSKYPLTLAAEEKGDYNKALELIKANENDPIISRVSVNYRLYKIAKAAGLEAEATKHSTFVLEHGGDTFYRRELEGVNRG